VAVSGALNYLPSDAHDVLEEHVAKLTEPWCKERIGKTTGVKRLHANFKNGVQYQQRHIN
jgi:hypothetical protein